MYRLDIVCAIYPTSLRGGGIFVLVTNMLKVYLNDGKEWTWRVEYGAM